MSLASYAIFAGLLVLSTGHCTPDLCSCIARTDKGKPPANDTTLKGSAAMKLAMQTRLITTCRVVRG